MAPSENEIPRAILATVAHADRDRRARVTVRQLARIAPAAAGIVLILAALARFFGWSQVLPLGVLAALIVGALLFVVIARRTRVATDVTAARVDADAGLDGELRSAHWFAQQAGNEPWPQFHLDRAAVRIDKVSWRDVYPPVRAHRSWAVTGVMCVAAVTLTVRLPGAKPARLNVSGTAASKTDDTPGVMLPPDIAKRLQELLASAEAGKLLPQDAKKLAELNDMLKKIDPKANPDMAELLKKLQAAAAAAKNADKNADDLAKANGAPEDLKQAMEELASKLAEKNGAQAADKPGEASPNASEQQFGKSNAQSKNANQQGQVEMTMQMVREASDESQAQPMMAGGAQGGDSMSGRGGGNNPNGKGKGDLLKAETLKRELVEANQDIAGQNVTKEDLRKKTEQGKSTLAYTHVTAAAVDRSKATPPPPVPDARKALVQSYFIRKQ